MRLIIMFIAIALAAGAFFITIHFTSQEPEKPLPVVQPQPVIVKEPTVDVYTAKQDIPIGSVIKREMLDIQPWPKNLQLPDMIPADPNQPSELVGMVARTPFQKGEPMILNKLANAKDPSFLAAALPKGMRVVTIGTDAVAGVAGFIFPGDHVDVLITHDVPAGSVKEDEEDENASPEGAVSPAPGGAAGTGAAVSGSYANTAAAVGGAQPKKEPVTEVLIPDVRVMAVNQKSTAHGGDVPVSPSNISLEVSVRDAQRLRLAENGNGRLSLALRSLKDKDEAPIVPPSTLSDLSRHTQGEAAEENSGSVAIVRGVKLETVGVARP